MVYKKERAALAKVMQQLRFRDLSTYSGGDMSMRVSPDRFLINAVSMDLKILNPRQIALMTLDGENLSPGLQPSIESAMHRKIFLARQDVQVVLHAYPKSASFLSSAGSVKIRTDLVAKARFLLGEPAFAPYALMGSEALGDTAAKALGQGFAVLLKNHGALVVGATLQEAFDRMELLETCATMTLMGLNSRIVSPLSIEQQAEIDSLHN